MSEQGLLPYLDIPFQHASPRILKLARRPAAARRTLDVSRGGGRSRNSLRSRSSWAPGGPGADFELRRGSRRPAHRVGCSYSPVAGAAASALPGAVPGTQGERRARFMAAQARSAARDRGQGSGRDVGGSGRQRVGRYRARPARPTPRIDGVKCIVGVVIWRRARGCGACPAADGHDLEACLAPARQRAESSTRPPHPLTTRACA